jgi:hypothetical protein
MRDKYAPARGAESREACLPDGPLAFGLCGRREEEIGPVS